MGPFLHRFSLLETVFMKPANRIVRFGNVPPCENSVCRFNHAFSQLRVLALTTLYFPIRRSPVFHWLVDSSMRAEGADCQRVGCCEANKLRPVVRSQPYTHGSGLPGSHQCSLSPRDPWRVGVLDQAVYHASPWIRLS